MVLSMCSNSYGLSFVILSLVGAALVSLAFIHVALGNVGFSHVGSSRYGFSRSLADFWLIFGCADLYPLFI